MGLEGPISDISDLNEEWPEDSETQLQSDDHIRVIKDAVKKQFTSLASVGGVVTVTAVELNYLSGVSSNIQDQLNDVTYAWRYSNATAITALPGDRILVEPPVGGTIVQLPTNPQQGVEIQIIDISGLAEPPDNTIVIQRGGSNTINNITRGIEGLTSFTFLANGQQYTLAYLSGVWYAWAVSGFYT